MAAPSIHSGHSDKGRTLPGFPGLRSPPLCVLSAGRVDTFAPAPNQLGRTGPSSGSLLVFGPPGVATSPGPVSAAGPSACPLLGACQESGQERSSQTMARLIHKVQIISVLRHPT